MTQNSGAAALSIFAYLTFWYFLLIHTAMILPIAGAWIQARRMFIRKRLGSLSLPSLLMQFVASAMIAVINGWRNNIFEASNWVEYLLYHSVTLIYVVRAATELGLLAFALVLIVTGNVRDSGDDKPSDVSQISASEHTPLLGDAASRQAA
jgi:hypothetical protein